MKTDMIGAVIHINWNDTLIQQAGIRWLRHGFPWPWEEDGVTLRKAYLDRKEEARDLIRRGYHLFGTVCGIGSYRYNPQTHKTQWAHGTPAYIGGWDEDRYYEAIEKQAEFVVKDCADMVTYWQLSNEPDNRVFHGEMTYDQVKRFLISAANGAHRGNPHAKVGSNLAEIGEYSLNLAHDLCQAEGVFDYIGLDGYLGSWAPGGPQEWKSRIDTVYAAAGKPVVINEWGYSTLESGPNPDPEHKRYYNEIVCRDKEWKYHWGNRLHTEESQAEFIMQTMKVFREHPAVLGEFFFRWSDTETCWQCGDPLCPSECAWGIVDVNGKPKPGYYALKAAYEKYFQKEEV